MQLIKFVKCFLKLFSVFEENQGFQRQNLTFEKLSETAKLPFLPPFRYPKSIQIYYQKLPKTNTNCIVSNNKSITHSITEKTQGNTSNFHYRALSNIDYQISIKSRYIARKKPSSLGWQFLNNTNKYRY